MNQLPSAEFRKQYAALTEVTQVTANGHVIGTWLPGSPRPVAQIRNDGLIETDPWRIELAGKIKAELEKSGVTFSGAAWRGEGTPPFVAYLRPPPPPTFVLDVPMAPMPELSVTRQTPCACEACTRIYPKGCYGADEDRSKAEQLCETTDCPCWGGADRLCAGCWVATKVTGPSPL